MSDEEKVLSDLEHTTESHSVMLRNHWSQGQFEKSTISEIESKITKKPYPLDGRNLELTASFLRRKKRKLGVKEVGEIASKASRRSTAPDSDDIARIFLDNGSEYLCREQLWDKLYGFQKIGVKFLLSKYELNTGCLLADEMGLGKSIQVVSFLASLSITQKRLDHAALIICPATLMSHWEDEIEKWAPNVFDVRKLERETDSVSKTYSKSSCVYIVSYEMFRSRFGSRTRGHQFSVVILDEAQKIRNPDSKITIAVKQINCHCRIALSGSPIQNNLSELWSIFDFVAPGRLGTLPTFQEELAVPIEEGTRPKASFHQVQLSHKCAIVVRDLITPLMIRRLKTDFSTELQLSNKEEQVLFCQLSEEQIEIYAKYLSTNTVRDVVQKQQSSRNAFKALSVLRRICNHPDLLLSDPNQVEDYGDESRSGKLSVLIPLLKLWKKQGKRCLVFSQSLAMLDLLELVLSRLDMSFNRMDGSTHLQTRSRIVEKFDSTKVYSGDGPFCLLLSTRVGGVGLNLTAASRVVIFDADWNPMTDAQARERSWRIGQKEDVKIYRLVAADSIEEVICKRQIYKHHLANKILVDPRQARVQEWDSVYDLFKAPSSSSSSRQTKISGTSRKIFDEIEKQTIKMDDKNEESPEETTEGLTDLITKVINQDDIETPTVYSSLVDMNSINEAAKRAIEMVLNSSRQTGTDITVPTWTGKSGNTGYLQTTSQDRSRNLLDKLKSSSHAASTTTVYESPQLVVERRIVKDIINYLKRRADFSETTQKILLYFQDKIGDEGEIFRSCLRQLCDFDDGYWTLRSQHR
jgi:DNA excision repair protein ERCC-6